MPLCHLPSIPIEKLKCSSPDLVFANTRIERCSATEAQRQVLFMRLGGVEMAEREIAHFGYLQPPESDGINDSEHRHPY